ncbi:MAG: PhzF family phenazine biosynthesis protein [Deltaproteobacteria bacterium]|nr:PhzF family phenazine biosynthesis protein [Deltaproteobacteria bacterium]
MGIPIFQVDAFTNRPFSGNPAAVCILSESKDELWMQDVAKEMNLSETAFLKREGEGFNLRWFTPTVEVDLCGHATLASAHILWDEGYLRPDQQVKFYTRSGILTAERNGEWIALDFPSEPEEEADAPSELIKALGITPIYVGKNRFDYLVEVDSEETVRDLKPDFPYLAKVDTRGIIVTSRSSAKGYDFVSRFFAPRVGINEDPVTGSAHCCLAPFWKSRLKKDEFTAYQASSRGGEVRVRVNKDRVYLCGQALTVLRGELVLP